MNLDFPVWMIDRLDREAGRLGVPRQSLIKVWIGEHLERSKSKQKRKANKAGRTTLRACLPLALRHKVGRSNFHKASENVLLQVPFRSAESVTAWSFVPPGL